MKRVLLIFLVSLIAGTASDAESASQLASEAQRSYLGGDLEAAKLKFKQALEIDPSNITAKNYLRMIAVQEAKAGGGAPLERKLRSLVLPAVKFRDATFSAALESLKQQAALQAVAVSFVTQLPPEMMAKLVTLNLSNVPFTEALRYLCELNGAKFVVEKFAILITPASAAAPAQ